jgi:hypothetical protein
LEIIVSRVKIVEERAQEVTLLSPCMCACSQSLVLYLESPCVQVDTLVKKKNTPRARDALAPQAPAVVVAAAAAVAATATAIVDKPVVIDVVDVQVVVDILTC